MIISINVQQCPSCNGSHVIERDKFGFVVQHVIGAEIYARVYFQCPTTGNDVGAAI